ncbi:MAG: hypothetical protein WBN04_02740 [Paracoccaceae bacterium]
MRLLLTMSAAAVVLSGCAPVAIVYDASRKGSVSVAERILAQTHPDVDSGAAAECVIAGMTYGEIVKLGTSDTTKVTVKSRDLVAEMVQRPKTAECLAALPKVQAE